MNSRKVTRLYNRSQQRIKREDKKLFNECFKELRKIVFQEILECAKQGFTGTYLWEDNLMDTAFDNFPEMPPVRKILDKIKNLLKKRGFIVEEDDVAKNKYGRSITYSKKRWYVYPKQLEQKQGGEN